jgi:hypothetical protein
VLGACLAILGAPGTAAAQASAELSPYVFAECNSNTAGFPPMTYVSPKITGARPVVYPGQYVWARWTAYRGETTILGTTWERLSTSLWWKGVADSKSIAPGLWMEQYINAGSTLYYNSPKPPKTYQPGWTQGFVFRRVKTTFLALMEFAWQPIGAPSTTRSMTTWPKLTVWASGNCS